MINKLGGAISSCTTGGYILFLVYFDFGAYLVVKEVFTKNFTQDNAYRAFIWPN